MNYYETTFMRYLKRLKPLTDNSVDQENTVAQSETLQSIEDKVSRILTRFDEIRGDNEENISMLKEEFRAINFQENEEYINLAAKLVFRKAFDNIEFGFGTYYSLAVGLRRQSVVTYQKFVIRLVALCHREIRTLKQELYSETPNAGRHLQLVCAMIDELFWRGILSTHDTCDYIHSLIRISTAEVLRAICELLRSIGPEIDSITKMAQLYMTGMRKLGKELDWFKEFRTLGSAFSTLRKLKLEENLPEELTSEITALCASRANNWNADEASQNYAWEARRHYQEGKRMLETVYDGSDDEDDSFDPAVDTPESNGITCTNAELEKYFGSLSIGIQLSAEHQDLLKDDLSNREHYFHAWLGNYFVTTTKAKTIIRSLYEYVHKPIAQRFELLFKAEKQATLQYAASPLVEAFLDLKLGKVNLAKSNVKWVEGAVQYFLKTGIISEEYCSGLTYLCTLLRIDWSLLTGTATEDAARTLQSTRFEDLKPKAQSIVWVARWMLDQTIYERQRISVKHLMTARDLDPEYWVWNYMIYNRLRFQRRQNSDRFGTMPTADELDAILNAVQVTPSRPLYHAMCTSALCQCLADILRCRKSQSIKPDPVDIRTCLLQTNDSILQYIYELVGNALEGKTEICFPEYVRYAEILSAILPIEYLNNELAEFCYIQCITKKPRNSKALHQLGVLYLKAKSDVVTAISYFHQAVHFQPTNFPAWMSLLQSVIGTVSNNELEVFDTFARFKATACWNSNQRYQIYFLYGCLYWVVGDMDNAIEEWMQLDHQDPKQVYSFQVLRKMQATHLWPRRLCFTVQTVLDELQIRSMHDGTLHPLRAMLENAAINSDERNKSGQTQRANRNQLGSRSYTSRNRATSDSGNYQCDILPNRDLRPRSNPVSTADQDMSWRSSGSASSTSSLQSRSGQGGPSPAGRSYGSSQYNNNGFTKRHFSPSFLD